MIQANELRIGNVVNMKFSENDYILITGVNEDNVSLNEVTWDYIELEDIDPIPLTEEWLLKFGFEKTVTETKHFKVEYIDYRMGQFVLFLLKSGGVEVEFCAAHDTIKDRGYLVTLDYVHQLQNLYFALTGDELT